MRDLSIAHSAVDYLQRIVEDFYFGTGIRPFKVQCAPRITSGVSSLLSSCTFMMGDIHGTTMFRLEVCSPVVDDEKANDKNDGNDSPDSDSDYPPSLSDMEEEDDDEE
jgi:hypothetical protein